MSVIDFSDNISKYGGSRLSAIGGYKTVFMLDAMLLIECTADMKSVRSPLGVPTSSLTAQLITKDLVDMIKVCFCSNNGGTY